MKFFYYIQTDENGFITGHFESTKQAAPEQTELIEIDRYDPSIAGRYYLNGEIGPEPQEGHYWRWDEDANEFIETPFPTE